MRKRTTLLLLLISVTAWSQKLPKIKGSGILETKEVTISEGFNRVEIDGNIEVELKQDKKHGYAIETDDNLLEVVTFTMKDSTLRVGVTHNITRKKDLKITITAEVLSQIYLANEARAKAAGKLSGKNLWIEAGRSTKFDFDLAYTDTLHLVMFSNASGKLSSKSLGNNLKLEDKASLDFYTVADRLTITAQDNARLTIDGTMQMAKLSAKGGAKITAKDASIIKADIHIADNADMVVNAKEKASLYLQDDGVLELYGDPEIIVTGLKNKAKIVKKE